MTGTEMLFFETRGVQKGDGFWDRVGRLMIVYFMRADQSQEDERTQEPVGPGCRGGMSLFAMRIRWFDKKRSSSPKPLVGD